MNSFQSPAGRVRAWALLMQVPVNLASLAFVAEFLGEVIALLAVGGLLAGGVIVLWQRGLSRAVAFGVLIFWLPLVALIWFYLGNFRAPEVFLIYLRVLMWINAASLLFALRDAWKWWRGDRAVFGRI